MKLKLSANEKLRGNQQASFFIDPAHGNSFAVALAKMTTAYGLKPDEWQLRVLDSWLGFNDDGAWSAPTCGLSVPRQNGKNALLEMRELFGLVALGEKILHTAHEVRTAKKAFNRLVGFFDNKRKMPELAGMVKKIRATNGQESIELVNGGMIEFIARSKSAARGFSVDCIVMDEAQDMHEEALAAMMPTLSASPSGNPQSIMVGTPPLLDMIGQPFWNLRDAAHSLESNNISWFEWSAESDVDVNDKTTWADTNPALGGRLLLKQIENELSLSASDGIIFRRERLGTWLTGSESVERFIPDDIWARCAKSDLNINGNVNLGIDVHPLRNYASIVAVVIDPISGKPVVDVIESRAGTPNWVVNYISELTSKQNIKSIVIDEKSQAVGLLDDFKLEKLKITKTNMEEYADACASFYDKVQVQGLYHLDQAVLNSAVAGVVPRPLAGRFAWKKVDNSIDITPIVAATLALHGMEKVDQKTVLIKPKQAGRIIAL